MSCIDSIAKALKIGFMIHMQCKVISAEGELNASRALKEAAGVIATSPTALQLRYLQTLSTIAAERSSSIFFPIPIDILSGLVSINLFKKHL